MQDPDLMVVMALITNSVHSIASVTEEPVAILLNWRLYQVRDHKGSRQRHLVGCVQGGSGGRVTSALVKIDLTSATAVTSSGRMYRLKGPPGFDDDADYVWKVWQHINLSTHVRDVTRALAKVLGPSQSHAYVASCGL